MRRLLIIFVVLPLLCGLPTAAQASYHAAAASWIVIDGHSGDIQASFKPDALLYPASLTKMLTAQVVLDRAGLGEIVHISHNAATAPADHLQWPEGATYTVEQMLYGMHLMSSNGAAIALAEYVAGSERSFIALMNDKARFLNVSKSLWATPEGLDAYGQLATARDLAVIARSFMARPVLARIARTRRYTLPWRGGHIVLQARNAFLKSYRGAIGIKPGYTTLAQNCLAAAAVRNGRMLIAIVMRSPSAVADATALLDEAFARPPVTPRFHSFRLPVFPGPAQRPDGAGPTSPAPPALDVRPSGSRSAMLPRGTVAYLALSGVVTAAIALGATLLGLSRRKLMHMN
ncbi:MAG: D-alanyl-D-alanine carboxypeptidase family protein [Actinomycetota bacterium]|nr:serine hydrolase [Actinomycetota bacterium]